MSEIADEFLFIANEDAAGQRIDAFLSAEILDCSRSFIAELIRLGRVTVGRKKIKPGYRLRPGDEIHGQIPAPEPVDFQPQNIPLDIIYQDKDLIVLNKPAGMVVHPSPGHRDGTLVNALLHCCPDLSGIGGEVRPGIVHRLDKDTTGILIAAKNADAQTQLAHQFKSRSVRKKYLAIVHGHMKESSGKILLPVGRHPIDRKKMSTVTRSGKTAETRWKVMEPLTEASLVEVDLLTGRTHQIRVHFAAIHHAVIGDPVYGPRSTPHSAMIRQMLQPIGRQMLHAWKIRFMHPKRGVEMNFKAPLPPDMRQLIDGLRSPNQAP